MWQDMTTPAMKASVYQPDCFLLSFPMDIMISDNEETRFVTCKERKDIGKRNQSATFKDFFCQGRCCDSIVVGPNRHALN